MNSELYPWPGKYETGDHKSPVAVVTLDEKFEIPPHRTAIWGPMKTENLGIEKVVANTISNPYIRFLIVCGKEIRGHKSGASLVCLAMNGIDDMGRIIDAPGAVPYIENINQDAVERFRDQVEVIDLVGTTDIEEICKAIDTAHKKDPSTYGEPYIALSIKEKKMSKLEADLALHASLNVSPWGDISPLEAGINV